MAYQKENGRKYADMWDEMRVKGLTPRLVSLLTGISEDKLSSYPPGSVEEEDLGDDRVIARSG